MDNEQIKNNGADSVPTFTPPTPTFTPPKNTKPDFNGPACSYHKDEPAVAQCARCGKNLCEDCVENYQVIDGEYAGQPLCYDCCKEMVAENVKLLNKQKRKIIIRMVLTGIGLLIGGLFGAGIGYGGLDSNGSNIGGGFIGCIIGALIFGSFSNVIFRTIKLWADEKAGGFVGSLIASLFIAPFYTIKKTVEYIVFLKRTMGSIESDSASLGEMKEYMEYTLVRNQNKGVDLETLINQNSQLSTNSYVQMIQTQGEEQAETNIRNAVASINENGEIIRNFVV